MKAVCWAVRSVALKVEMWVALRVEMTDDSMVAAKDLRSAGTRAALRARQSVVTTAARRAASKAGLSDNY
jgi:hypothetical protein